MYENTSKKSIDKISILIVLLNIILFFMIKNNFLYSIFVNSLYIAFLIAMCIIISNTSRFNKSNIDTTIGIIFIMIGIFEIMILILNFGNLIIKPIETFFYVVVQILKLLGAYCGLYLSIEDMRQDYDRRSSIAMMFSFIVGFVIIYILSGGESIDFLLECYLLLITILISYKYFKRTKLLNISYRQNIIENIFCLFVFLRIVIVLLYICNKFEYVYFINRVISSVCVYYIYKKIVNHNIKRPYKELDISNQMLKSKAKVLNENNEKIILGMKKTQILKERLKLKEEKLISTINGAMNPTVIFSKNNGVIYNNNLFYTQFSCSDKEDIQDVIESKFELYDEILNNVNYVINYQKELKCTMKSKDDSYYHIIFTPFIINNENEGCLCIFIDRTKETKFKKEILSVNLCYEKFLESITDGIVILKEGKVVYYNKAFKKMFKNEIYKINLNIDKNKNCKEESYIVEGNVIHVKMTYSTYNKNKMSIVIRNITEQKRLEQRLRDRNESYSKLIDILPDGICLIKKNLEIRYLNKSLLNMLEIGKNEDIIGKNIKEIIKLGIDEKTSFINDLKVVLKDKKKILFLNKEIVTKENNIIEVEINVLPFIMDEEEYIMFIVKDLTNKKRSELVQKQLSERLETDKVKTEFFTNMSHELKTPLNVIFSSNQLLESCYKNEKIIDYNDNIEQHIKLVKNNSYRLQRLINNIIDLTKMESGYYNLNLSKHNIVELIEDLFMKTEKYAMKKNLNLIFDTEVEEINMYIDVAEIERIILNLLSNCIKFTPNNGTICINIYNEQDGVKISVVNTGIGIPKNKLDTIFDEFSQVDRTLSRNTEGSGIGLSIVKNLVELHNGKIEVKSEDGKQTEFIILLKNTSVNEVQIKENRSIYNIEEKINIEFSDIYY